MRVPFGRALRAAFTYGIGFIGIFLILDLMLSNIATGAEMLVERTGVSLEIIDVGWPVDAAIAFGVPTFVTVFFGAIIINLVMFTLRWTITLDIDFHNYYQWVIPATLVYFFTDNLIAGTIVGLVNFILTLKIADWTEKDVAEFWELPGVSIPHTNSMGWWPFAYMVDWIIDRIPGLNKIRIDVKGLQEKIGVFGEPMIIGGLIGIGLGIGAGMSTVDTINLMLNLGASMILMPRMISLLMEGLVPVFQSARKWVLNRFPDYDFRIGLDAAVLIGKAEVLVIGMLMTPVMILLAFIMPGKPGSPVCRLVGNELLLSYFRRCKPRQPVPRIPDRYAHVRDHAAGCQLYRSDDHRDGAVGRIRDGCAGIVYNHRRRLDLWSHVHQYAGIRTGECQNGRLGHRGEFQWWLAPYYCLFSRKLCSCRANMRT